MSAPAIDAPDSLSRLIPSRVARGFLLAVVSGIFFNFLNASAKELASEMPPLYVSWGRWIAGIALIAPYMLWRVGLKGMRTRDLKLHCLRGVFHTPGYGLWYEAVAWLPLATMAALGFTGPIFVTLGAVIFLRETVHWRRWAAVGGRLLRHAGDRAAGLRRAQSRHRDDADGRAADRRLQSGGQGRLGPRQARSGRVVAERGWRGLLHAARHLVLANPDDRPASAVPGLRLLRHHGLLLHHLGLSPAGYFRPAAHYLPRHRLGRLDGRRGLGQDLRHLDLRGRGDHRGGHDLHRPSGSKSGRKTEHDGSSGRQGGPDHRRRVGAGRQRRRR